MLDKPSIQDLLEVQRDFDLPSPVLVEKDWHVVGALAAITTTDVKPFRLANCLVVHQKRRRDCLH